MGITLSRATSVDDWDLWSEEDKKRPCPFVKMLVRIRKNATGEIKEAIEMGYWEAEAGLPCIFNWEDGNFSCDCNRTYIFGEDDLDHCTEGRFSVNLHNPVTGKIFYQEFAP